MRKKIGALLNTILIQSFKPTVLGMVLLVYTASRSLNFIRVTLPPERQTLAWFGLAALDGGLIAWVVTYLRISHGWQRVIAVAMIILDALGMITIFTLDTLYQMGKSGMIKALTQGELYIASLALSSVIAANVIATVAYHLLDPKRLREQAEEEAFDAIEAATLREIMKSADQIAEQVAPQLAQDWKRHTRARYIAMFDAQLKSTGQPNASSPYVPQLISGNNGQRAFAKDVPGFPGFPEEFTFGTHEGSAPPSPFGGKGGKGEKDA